MNELMVISDVRCRINSKGDPELNLEDVARGLGFVQIKNKTSYVRWERVNKYLVGWGFPISGENDFIPEKIFYKLCFKAESEDAIEFQDKVTDEILPSIRKHGMYATDVTIEKMIGDPDFAIQLLTNLKEEKTKRLQLEAEKEQLSIQLDESKHWYTIKRVAHLNRIDWKTLSWKLLKSQSQQMRLKVDKIFDANYGEVNSYHEDVWKAVYPHLVY